MTAKNIFVTGPPRCGKSTLIEKLVVRIKEPQVSYPDVFDAKNADIGAENSYFWNINPDIST